MGDMDDVDALMDAYEDGEVTDQELLAGAPRSWKSKLPPLGRTAGRSRMKAARSSPGK